MSEAIVSGPVTVGSPLHPIDPRPFGLDEVGYMEEEFFLSGTATAYRAVGELGDHGHWDVAPASKAPFATRFLVRRPRDPARFSGVVVVEWMNVTVMETAPGWTYNSRVVIDAGAAWVGVSIQAIAIEGGVAAIQTGDPHQASSSDGLRHHNPDRYAALHHPGDTYSYDIFSQLAAALRSPGEVPVFGGERPTHIVAMGQSQSAAFLTTYINGVHPIAEVFDGFFVHSRGLYAAGLDGTRSRDAGFPARFRTDLDVPVMGFQTETDVGPVFRYAAARQPDFGLLRVWEVAGTAHADAYLVGPDFGLCTHRVNAGPAHYVLAAALESLVAWVTRGTVPPSGARLHTTGEFEPTIVRDARGNALGGVRTPALDVPVATLSGDPPEGADMLCALFGMTIPFEPATLAALYPDRGAYLAAFERSLDDAVAAGFVRAADRDEFRAEADRVEL